MPLVALVQKKQSAPATAYKFWCSALLSSSPLLLAFRLRKSECLYKNSPNKQSAFWAFSLTSSRGGSLSSLFALILRINKSVRTVAITIAIASAIGLHKGLIPLRRWWRCRAEESQKTGIKLQTKSEKSNKKVTPKPVKKPEKIWCVLSQKQTNLSTKSSKTLNN